MMERLIQTGYDAVFITEHNTVWSDEEIAQLQEGFPEIRIFPGVEISTGAGGVQHIVVLGTTDPSYLKLQSVVEILKKARADECLIVLAHPFRWEGGAAMLEEGFLPDAIEFRSGNHDAVGASMAKITGDRLNLPIVNVGDVHCLEDINHFWIETRRPIDTPADLRRIILERDYINYPLK